MPNLPITALTANESETAAKRRRSLELQAELAETELRLATLQSSLSRFEALYLTTVGRLLTEIDELEAQVAEAIACLKPKSESAQANAAGSRERARRTTAEADAAAQTPVLDEPFLPSGSLKSLYRDLAKAIHPDLTVDPAEKEWRTRMMAEANVAYRSGDEVTLREILAASTFRPVMDASEADTEMARLDLMIAQILRRIDVVNQQMNALQQSDLGALWSKYEGSRLAGRDLLSEMAVSLRRRIATMRRQVLAALDLLEATRSSGN